LKIIFLSIILFGVVFMNPAPPRNPSTPALDEPSLTTGQELLAVPNLYLFNPENRSVLEGEQAHIPRLPLTLMAVIFLIVAMLSLIFAISYLRDFYLFNTFSASTPATILMRGIHTTYSGPEEGGIQSYTLLYQFWLSQPDRHVYHGSAGVDGTTYRRLTEGTEVSIRFLPDNPRKSMLAQQIPDLLVGTNNAIAVACVAFMVMGACLWRDSKYRRLERDGRLVRGELRSFVQREVKDDGTKSFHITLRYSFHPPQEQGELIHGLLEETMSEYQFNHWSQPAEGAPLAIVYFNDELYHLL
jgi:hypothetical protein